MAARGTRRGARTGRAALGRRPTRPPGAGSFRDSTGAGGGRRTVYGAIRRVALPVLGRRLLGVNGVPHGVERLIHFSRDLHVLVHVQPTLRVIEEGALVAVDRLDGRRPPQPENLDNGGIAAKPHLNLQLLRSAAVL
eukprot:2528017-Prymnesium_polylepis.2